MAAVRLNEVLKGVNGGVGQGQWGHGEVALGQTGCGCGSDGRVVSSTLQGCKLYLTGCKLYLAGL